MELPIAPALPANPGELRRAVTQIVDLSHLGHQTLGDPELRRIVLRLFLDEAPGYARDIAAAKEAKSWRMAVHTIKGVALNIGAFRLAQLCKEHEGPTFGADGTAISEASGALAAMIETTAHTIRELLSQG